MQRLGRLDVLHDNAGGSTPRDNTVVEASSSEESLTVTGQSLPVDSGVTIS